MNDHEMLYLCGPMRGHALNNFPAFDAGRDSLKDEAFRVISPADMDRQHHIEATTDISDLTTEQWRDIYRRDLNAILDCDGIALLDGWSLSEGVTRLELPLAHFLRIPVKEVDTWILDARRANDAVPDPDDERVVTH